MNDVSIRMVPPSEIERHFGLRVDKPAVCYLGAVGGEVAGCGGLAWIGDRCFVFFNTNDGAKGRGLAVRRGLSKLLAMASALNESRVWITRDPAFPTSERLVRLLGFTKTDEILNGQEVWYVGT